jgi:hypothetical protein
MNGLIGLSNPEAFFLGGVVTILIALLFACLVWLGYCIGVEDKSGKGKN